MLLISRCQKDKKRTALLIESSLLKIKHTQKKEGNLL